MDSLPTETTANQQTHGALLDNSFWQAKYIQDFGPIPPTYSVADWHDCYKRTQLRSYIAACHYDYGGDIAILGPYKKYHDVIEALVNFISSMQYLATNTDWGESFMLHGQHLHAHMVLSKNSQHGTPSEKAVNQYARFLPKYQAALRRLLQDTIHPFDCPSRCAIDFGDDKALIKVDSIALPWLYPTDIIEHCD